MKKRMIKKQPLAKSLTAEKGFTMVEMLVAIVVLALGIMAVSAIFPLSLRVAQNMRTITKGTAYAHQKLDELRTLPFNSATLDTGTGTKTFAAETLENKYVRQYRVDGSIPMTGMKRVMVRVSWTHPDTDSVVIYTYLTRN